MYIEYLKFHR